MDKGRQQHDPDLGHPVVREQAHLADVVVLDVHAEQVLLLPVLVLEEEPVEVAVPAQVEGSRLLGDGISVSHAGEPVPQQPPVDKDHQHILRDLDVRPLNGPSRSAGARTLAPSLLSKFISNSFTNDDVYLMRFFFAQIFQEWGNFFFSRFCIIVVDHRAREVGP